MCQNRLRAWHLAIILYKWSSVFSASFRENKTISILYFGREERALSLVHQPLLYFLSFFFLFVYLRAFSIFFPLFISYNGYFTICGGGGVVRNNILQNFVAQLEYVQRKDSPTANIHFSSALNSEQTLEFSF